LKLARQTETRAHQLARDMRTLTEWLNHDILALAGPVLATRRALFDFVVQELQDARRIRPVRVALQNQRDDLLAFAGVLDEKLATIAQPRRCPGISCALCALLHRKPTPSPANWQGWNGLQSELSGRFKAVLAAVRAPGARAAQQFAGREPQTRGFDLTSHCVAIWARCTWTC
jgi:hypothetical protein